jgi:hypothetical protein
MLVAQVLPDDHKVEGSRLGNFLEAEDFAVEPTATSHISDQDGDVMDLRNLQHD